MRFFFSICSRHNDLPWNIRKFLKNQLREFRFDDLRDTHPWSRSAWSHTDLRRLKEGMVAAQVSAMITATTFREKTLIRWSQDRKRTIYIYIFSGRPITRCEASLLFSPSNRANILSRRRLVKEPVHHPFETLFEKSPFFLEPRFIAGRKLRALPSFVFFLPSSQDQWRGHDEIGQQYAFE